MAIVDCKKVSLNTVFFNVKGNAHSVLIVTARYALVSIDSIAFDNSVFFVRSSSGKECWQFSPIFILLGMKYVG